MANLTSFHQVPTPELVGQLLICGLFFLVVTRGLVSSKVVIIEFWYYPIIHDHVDDDNHGWFPGCMSRAQG